VAGPREWRRGTLYIWLDRHAAELDAASAPAMERLIAGYAQVFEASLEQFNLLAARVRAAIEAGEPFSVDRLRRLDYYRNLMEDTTRRLADFSLYASSQTEALQRLAIQQALRDTEDIYVAAIAENLVRRPNRSGWGKLPADMTLDDIRKLFHRLPEGALDNLVGALSDGSPLRDYFLVGHVGVPALTAEVIERMERELVRGLGMGMNPVLVGRRMADALGVGLERAIRIARTEMLRAYRRATLESYRANDDVIRGWRWSAALGPNTCAACIAADGSIHPLEEELVDHPNGRCQAVPVTIYDREGPPLRRVQNEEGEYELVETDGATWFEGLPDETKENILGPAVFRAYKDGKVTLSDLLGERHTDTFGTEISRRSLRDILGDEARAYYAEAA